MNDTDAFIIAFADLAYLYPHELAEAYPEEFWEYFHNKCPTISREKMKELLKETEKEQ